MLANVSKLHDPTRTVLRPTQLPRPPMKSRLGGLASPGIALKTPAEHVVDPHDGRAEALVWFCMLLAKSYGVGGERKCSLRGGEW